MKNAKRILAMFMAVVMLAGMLSVTAFADATKGTLELDRPNNSSIDMTTKTFKLYRVFNGHATADGKITYEWNTAATMKADKKTGFSADDLALIEEFGAFYAFFFCKETNGGVDPRITAGTGNELAQVAKYMENAFSTNADKAEFGTDIYNFIKNYIESGVEVTTEVTKTESSQIFENLSAGYYLVSDEASTGVVSALMMNTVADGTKTTITIKVVEPKLEKTVHAVNGVALPTGNVEGISAQVGDTVQFEIELDVPDYTVALAANGSFWYHFKDTGSTAMTLDPESAWDLDLYRKNAIGNMEKVKDLVINSDYLVLPKSKADAVEKLATGEEAYRRILGQLIVYFFAHDHYSDYATGNLNTLTDYATTILNTAMTSEAAFDSFLGHGGGGIVFRLGTSETYKAGDQIKIYVNALIDSDADENNGVNANTATLRYAASSKEHTPDPGNITEIDDDAKVYSHSLNMVKVAMTPTAPYDITETTLSGAKFKVYKDATTIHYLHFVQNAAGDYTIISDAELYYKADAAATPTQATEAQIKANTNLYTKSQDADKNDVYTAVTLVANDEIEVAADGSLDVHGFGTGKYMFVETVAPAGYALPEAPLGITISAEYTSGGSLNKLNGVADDGDTGNTHSMIKVTGTSATNNTIEGKITNALTKMLPSTGGNGAMLLTVFGSIGAVVMMAMLALELKKKKV